jgi:polar amino acid transport system substrate-binding protein
MHTLYNYEKTRNVYGGMDMNKRILGIVLVLTLAVALLLTGCGAAKGGKVVVAMDAAYPPFEFVDEKTGDFAGFDVELAKAISEKLKIDIEIKNIAWDGIFIGLETDRYDAIMSAVSITPDRIENYEFTKPYLANGQVIVTKPGDTTVKSVDDLKGKKVGVQTDTTSDTACKKKLDEKGQDFFQIMRYDEIIQTFEAMSAGHIDYIVVDYAVAIEYTAKSPEKYAMTDTQLTNEPIAVCIKKGNTELRDKFQKALDELAKEGKLSELSKKWFGDDYTQNIDENLY